MVIKMLYNIDSGELRHLIMIQEYIAQKDNEGFLIEEWQHYLTAKSKIVNTSGKEYQKNMSTASISTTKFIIRASKKMPVTTKNRILYNNDIYNIKYVNDIGEFHEFLEIVAELVNQ